MRLRRIAPVIAAVLGAAANARADDRPYQFEIGPTVGYASRHVASNPDGMGYDGGLAEGLVFRLTHAPWLKTSGRFLSEKHDLALGYGAFGTGAYSLVPTSKVSIVSLNAAAHPTYEFTSRFRAWLTVGITWGKISLPTVKLNGEAGGQTRSRSGVFLEAPLGAGASFDILKWLTISGDLLAAPPFSQTGDMYDASPEVGIDGKNRVLRPATKLSSSTYGLVTLAIAL